MKISLKNKPLQIPLLFAMLVMLFTSCRKEYSIENYNNNIAAGNWQFSEGGKEYAGNMDTTFIANAGSTKELHLIGTSNDGSQTFHMVLYAADSFKVGTYMASAYASSFEYGAGSPLLYSAGQLNGEFIVKITSINQTLITGTFSGKAVKNDQDTVDIVDGIFKSIFSDNSAAPTSSGVLGDNNGNCTPITIGGNYKQGIVMSPANTLMVEVTVAVPGTYQIYTDFVNGISFGAQGTFDQPGLQTVMLTGAGVPEDEGAHDFVVHFGNSQCAFAITFEPGAAPSGDYYPLSTPTDWYYTNGIDNLYARVTGGTFSWNSNTYNVIGIFDGPNDNTTSDTLNFVRKGGGNYYSYNDYTEMVQSSQPVIVETIFLKDNVAQGTTWDGPEFSAIIGGVTVKYHFKYTITAKAVPATVGTFDFPDVIKVSEELYSGTTNLGINGERWYARNVGMIYFNSDFTGTWSIYDFHIF